MINNLKALTPAFILGFVVMATSTQVLSQQGSAEECNITVDRIIRPVAEGRDNGVPREQMMSLLGTIGYNPQRAWNLTGMVYETLADKTPDEVVADFMDWCAGSGA